VTGIIQELLKLAALFIIVLWRRPKAYRYSVIGAFCGAGLAFVEACYQTGTTISPLFSLILVERGLFVLFHVAAGALIGRAMTLGTVPVARTIVLLIGLNTAFRYHCACSQDHRPADRFEHSLPLPAYFCPATGRNHRTCASCFRNNGLIVSVFCSVSTTPHKAYCPIMTGTV